MIRAPGMPRSLNPASAPTRARAATAPAPHARHVHPRGAGPGLLIRDRSHRAGPQHHRGPALAHSKGDRVEDFDARGRLWDRWSASYDQDTLGFDDELTADALHHLAAGGPALELGVGTGRIALPLARRGTHVLGLDASPKMTAHLLLAHRDQLPVEVRIADMATYTVEDQYSLIYCVASTFFLLPTQDLQLACLASSAKALAPGARLVIETAVAGTTGLPLDRQQTAVREIGHDHLKLSAIVHDPLTQTLHSQEIRIDADGYRMLLITRRYAHLPELDLMARCAGLQLYGASVQRGWRLLFALAGATVVSLGRRLTSAGECGEVPETGACGGRCLGEVH